MKRLLTLMLALILIAGASVIPAGAASTEDEALAVTAAAQDVPAVASGLAPVEEVAVPSPANTTAKTEVAETAAANYPQLLPCEANKVGIRVKWKAYSGAAKYRVFYRTGPTDKKWKKIGDTTALYLDHKGIKLETPYYYTVRAINKSGAYCSSYHTSGMLGFKTDTPTITKIENIAGGVKVSYKLPTKSYYLSIRPVKLFVTGGTYGSKWTSIGITNGDNYIAAPIDAKNSGTTLKFTARCFFNNSYTSPCAANVSATYVATPTFKVTSSAAGQQITVNKVKGAAKYRVFLKQSGKWTKLADTTSGYLNKNVRFNNAYCYTVRAMNAAGKYVSGYITDGIAVKYCRTPSHLTLTPIRDGLFLSWGNDSYASYDGFYRVFRKGPGDAKWVALYDTQDSVYYDYDVEPGAQYTYTVRCINQYGFYTSDFEAAGVTAFYGGTPDIYYVENTAEGITFAWLSEDCVPTYHVFLYRDGQWEKIAETDEDYYTFTEVEEGVKYDFRVRGVTAAGEYCTVERAMGIAVNYYSEAERTFDQQEITDTLRQTISIVGPSRIDTTLPDNQDAIRFYIAYTGSYGENTGDVTNYVAGLGMRRIEESVSLLENLGYQMSDFTYYLDCEEQEGGEYLYYLYFGSRK